MLNHLHKKKDTDLCYIFRLLLLYKIGVKVI